MNILIWNIRGMGNSASLAQVKKLIVEHSPLVLALIEPLVNNSNMLHYLHRLGYNDASSNANDKLWLFWKRNTHLSIISQTDQLVHTTLGGYGDAPLHLTFVYAKCSYILYRSLSHDLTILLAFFSGPWMVVGILMWFGILMNILALHHLLSPLGNLWI